jgi:hypothetical protein
LEKRATEKSREKEGEKQEQKEGQKKVDTDDKGRNPHMFTPSSYLPQLACPPDQDHGADVDEEGQRGRGRTVVHRLQRMTQPETL